MVPVPIAVRNSQSTRFLYILSSISTQYVLRFIRRTFGDASDDFSGAPHLLLKRAEEPDRSSTKFIVFACLIPVLVVLSGLFAGLTLGYMSLDVTQLNVLSISGTPYVDISPLMMGTRLSCMALESNDSMQGRLSQCARMAICFS
jgi:metal transporter CNNM